MAKRHTSNLQCFVDRLAGRSVLSARERSRILELPARIRQARSNEDFVSLGQRVEHAHCVVDGLVGRFDQNARGDRQITALHIRGDMPDLHAVVQPSAGSALQALSAVTILEVPHAALRQASAGCAAIAEAFWRDCMVDSMILAEWVVNVGRRDAVSRLAHLLCEMAWRYKVAPVGGKLTFELPLTQSQLADATGLTPVHVNRTLKRLAEIGTSLRHKTVRIEDYDELARIGDFDPGYLHADSRSEERIGAG